jgi:hypothetical protein
MRNVSYLFLSVLLGLSLISQAHANSINIENASFELPAIDPTVFPVSTYATGWTEIDNDVDYSTNTGAFRNTDPNSFDHIINVDGDQCAFLGSESGNGFEQDLDAVYNSCCDYRFTVAIGVSSRFPPSSVEPVDNIELALFYRDVNDPNVIIDIVTTTVSAAGQLMTQLQDFSLYLPAFSSDADWAGKNIGIAIRAAGNAGGFWTLDDVRLVEMLPVSINIENASFELPAIDPSVFPVSTYAQGWTEIDNDVDYSTNTGAFRNTDPNSFDHIINVDGDQCAFLGSQSGNGFEQDLDAVYNSGCDYRFTVAIGVSSRFPPSSAEPVDNIELALFYRDVNDPNIIIDIVTETVSAAGQLMTQLQDFSLYLPAVSSDSEWAGKNIGIAIRAAGNAGGFWTLDDVRLVEMLPVSINIENASFELPAIDPSVFPVSTYAQGWTEIDNDVDYSTNTGAFRNTDPNSFDHIINVDGDQCAFLGSQSGNGFEQDLDAVYNSGCDYRFTVAIGVSSRFQPSAIEPIDNIELALFYRDANDPNIIIDIVTQTVSAAGQLMTQLQDFSLYLPTVSPDSDWAGKNIGIAIRAAGNAGGFWTLDNVRLGESLPMQDSLLADKE